MRRARAAKAAAVREVRRIVIVRDLPRGALNKYDQNTKYPAAPLPTSETQTNWRLLRACLESINRASAKPGSTKTNPSHRIVKRICTGVTALLTRFLLTCVPQDLCSSSQSESWED